MTDPATRARIEKLVQLAAINERCARAMYEDSSCFFSSSRGNGDENAFACAGALNEVADLFGVPGPSEILDRLYKEAGDG